MAINYPTSLDNFTGKQDNVDDVQAVDMNNVQDACMALEAKVGVNSSSITSSLEYRLSIIENCLTGIIVMWSGAIVDIPAGWYLCDGNNGTPNLRDKFIVGAGSSYAVANTGGSTTMTHTHTGGGHVLTTNEMPSHTHSLSGIELYVVNSWGSNLELSKRGTGPATAVGSTGGGASHSHGATSGASNTENRPPYYSLAYIMKV